ncbi:MAG: radical SAM protein [Thermodesulfobacteriota bacterium]
MPHKTCSLDCVYCECGKTTHLTVKQKIYTPPEEIRQELDRFLSPNPRLDHVTFSGSGEPTLHSGIGELIGFLKSAHPNYRVALLTNGTLFHDPRIRKAVAEVDIVIASLDAATEDTFARLNRPHPGLNLADMIEGLVALRKEFANQLWLEIFIVPGMNDTAEELAEIRKAVRKINPDTIHLNSLDRPGTEAWVNPLGREKLIEIQEIIEKSEIIHYTSTSGYKPLHLKNEHQHIIATLKRRPCTAEDVSRITGVAVNDVQRHLDALSREGRIQKQNMPRGDFYKLKI